MNISASRERNTNLLFYMNFEKFNRYIQTSQLRFLIGSAAVYLQNMESVQMVVESSSNTVSSESVLHLK